MLKYFFSNIIKRMSCGCSKSSKIDKTVLIEHHSYVYKSKVEYGSYIGNSSLCVFSDIGKFCSISDHVFIGSAEHPLNYVSTSSVFYGGYRKFCKKIVLQNIKWDSYTRKTIIGNDVWIGAGAFIKSGINIGDGAVIGAGSVVTKDVGPYEIWAGNPAKLIRKRFDDSIIEKLLKIKWWNLPLKTIKKTSVFFNDVNAFIDTMEKSDEYFVAH